ncbi:hypothetical protein JTB14_002787 [Gonioctena quinquepunctata]|nr:hypothetical protein JTB14_002787 [Gonioctena quinquepunctata]
MVKKLTDSELLKILENSDSDEFDFVDGDSDGWGSSDDGEVDVDVTTQASNDLFQDSDEENPIDVPTAKNLLNQGTNCTGTLRLDRKNVPIDVKNAKLAKGNTIARYAEGIMIGKWRDKRDVSYISTEFENNMIEIETRRKEKVNKPLPVVQYNKINLIKSLVPPITENIPAAVTQQHKLVKRHLGDGKNRYPEKDANLVLWRESVLKLFTNVLHARVLQASA